MEAVRRNLPKNPRSEANAVSNLLFLWTATIFKKGYKKTLELTDLYETLTEDRSHTLGEKLERNWNEQKKCSQNKRPSLIKAIALTFWKNHLTMVMLAFSNHIVIRLTQPYLLGELLLYFREDSSMTFYTAFWYTIGLVALSALNALIINQYFIGCAHIGMKTRISVGSLIYRKALKLSQTARGEIAVVNLFSNDISRLDAASTLMHVLWSAPLMTLIIGYFLWLEARWAGMIGLAVMLLVVVLQSYTGKLTSKFRFKTAEQTDVRIKFMDEIITGVRVIKMFAWEIPFGKMIEIARRKELNILKKNSYIQGLQMTFILFTNRMAMFCTMLSIYLLYGTEDLVTSKIFVISAYFQLVAHAMILLFVDAVGEVAKTYVSIKRVESFLEYDEINEKQEDLNLKNNTAISVKNITANWEKEEVSAHKPTNLLASGNVHTQRLTLDYISVDVQKRSLIGIIGPVGSGKSSFLQALLRELPLKSGSISISGTMSYVSQEPWIFAGSVRQNVIFGSPFDANRYDLVIRSCALHKDFENFECGDKTLIGDRGISLSGGQKARVNLARSIYRESDIYLFDDPLSAVDTHVGRHLFNECIGPNGFLAERGCTRILVTHQIHFLKDADLVIVLRDGKLDFKGTPMELSNLGIDFSEHLQMDGDIDVEIVDQRHDDKVVNLADVCQEKMAELEDVSKSENGESLLKIYLRSGANHFVLPIVLALFLLTQILASASDYWVSFWTSQEEARNIHLKTSEYMLVHSDNRSIPIEIANINATNDKPTLTTSSCITIHGSITMALLIIAIARSISFYTICLRASRKLHNAMFKGIISTSLRFFDTNPAGRIFNLFAKDVGAIDEYLPKSILDATQNILIITGSVGLTIIVRPLFIIPLILIGTLFVYVRRVYLRSSLDIKRMEGITRSPVFTHLSATLHGLETIRALKAENVLIEEFDNHQDLHSSCWFMFISTNFAFGLSLDILCFLFASFVMFSVLLSGRSVLGNEVGLIITQIFALTGKLQWGIRQAADASNQLMSVERVLQYKDLAPEMNPENESTTIEHDFPSSGKLEFRNVSYRYSDNLQPVLKKLNFAIKPNEKVGIVGRTGAGKSSLIGAIFRLAIVEGEILIDSVNTATIKLSDLRSKITIIPQDAILFSGTLRRNLDPYDEYSDSNIWEALEEVKLKDIVSGPDGLQSSVMTGGSNYSVGQRQLICLARAILRKNKILILDEATANVDPHTDLLIQQKIQEKFADCSVLTIAHRLHTIIDSDRVLVMDAGNAVEFASPHELLQNKNGIFYEMVQLLGTAEEERLTKIALLKYQSSQ